VREQQELAFRVDGRALYRFGVPRVADFEPAVGLVHVEKARCSNHLAGLPIVHLANDEGHGAQPLAHVQRNGQPIAGLFRRGHGGVPEPPQLAIGGRSAHFIQMLWPERFQPGVLAGQRDGLDQARHGVGWLSGWRGS
jgi:hypothetical protein